MHQVEFARDGLTVGVLQSMLGKIDSEDRITGMWLDDEALVIQSES